MKASLYLDEDVIPGLAGLLRRLGYDAVSAHELGHLSWSGEEHLSWATGQRRAVFTFNRNDFITLFRDWYNDGRAHAGIIVSHRQYSRDEVESARRVGILLDNVSAADFANTLWAVEQYTSFVGQGNG